MADYARIMHAVGNGIQGGGIACLWRRYPSFITNQIFQNWCTDRGITMKKRGKRSRKRIRSKFFTWVKSNNTVNYMDCRVKMTERISRASFASHTHVQYSKKTQAFHKLYIWCIQVKGNALHKCGKRARKKMMKEFIICPAITTFQGIARAVNTRCKLRNMAKFQALVRGHQQRWKCPCFT